MIPNWLLEKCDYCDLRVFHVKSEAILLDKTELRSSSEYVGTTYGVRVLIDGAWGLASTNMKSELNSTFEKAYKMAKAASRYKKTKFKINYEIDTRDKKAIKPKIDPFSLTKPQKINFFKDISKEVMKLNKRISPRISYSSKILKKEFYNSFGADIKQEFTYTESYLTLTTLYDGKVESHNERKVHIGGFEGMEKFRDKALKGVKKLERKIKLKRPPKGKFNVILDEEITGLFFHEGVGHACEADEVVEKRSILRGKLGRKIASSKVTLYSDPTLKKGFGFYFYDDEGVKARRVPLIKRGVLVGYMHNLETSSRMKTNPTSNGRSESAGSKVLVRMNNMYLEPGDLSKKELFETLKNGLYLRGFAGGGVDTSTGEFSFKALEVFEIKNSVITNGFKEGTISGNIATTLKNITHLGKMSKFSSNSPGFCGKGGQHVPVDEKMPKMIVRGANIG